MDEPDLPMPVFCDDTHMAYYMACCIGAGKQDQIASSGSGNWYGDACICKINRRTGYGNIKMSKNIADKAGTIESLFLNG